jgi:beta-lactamase class A
VTAGTPRLTVLRPDDTAMVLAVAVPGLLEQHADEVLPLASAGKVLLLAETARALVAGELDGGEPLDIRDDDYCGGSGLLVQLSARRWTVADLALLTASVSDNTATNALLRRVGIEQVNAQAHALGLRQTRLLDRIREPRLPYHAPTFAEGTARELAALAERIAGDELWARTVLDWMATSTDRSMVPAFIPHDPEDHAVPIGDPEHGLWLANKTGVDEGTRADVGVVRGSRQACYAVIARGPAGTEHDMVRAMREVGALIYDYVS